MTSTRITRWAIAIRTCATFVACMPGCAGDPTRAPPLDRPTKISLTSDSGDYIGSGRIYVYDQSNSVITVADTGRHLTISVAGDERWTSHFLLPAGLTTFRVGTYRDLPLYLAPDSASGALTWSGEGRGCNMMNSALFVDSSTYHGASLATLDLRFEQHCEQMPQALRGTIHWSRSDKTAPPGPVNPPPATLWRPAPGTTPATGNFVYLESDSGNWIGQGRTYAYPPASAAIAATVVEGALTIDVMLSGSLDWRGKFKEMNSLSQLQPGYYANLRRYPFHNPAKGGISWSGMGRGCEDRGWFVVDSVRFTGGAPTMVDLRFETNCGDQTKALRGAVRWRR